MINKCNLFANYYSSRYFALFLDVLVLVFLMKQMLFNVFHKIANKNF